MTRQRPTDSSSATTGMSSINISAPSTYMPTMRGPPLPAPLQRVGALSSLHPSPSLASISTTNRAPPTCLHPQQAPPSCLSLCPTSAYATDTHLAHWQQWCPSAAHRGMMSLQHTNLGRGQLRVGCGSAVGHPWIYPCSTLMFYLGLLYLCLCIRLIQARYLLAAAGTSMSTRLCETESWLVHGLITSAFNILLIPMSLLLCCHHPDSMTTATTSAGKQCWPMTTMV